MWVDKGRIDDTPVADPGFSFGGLGGGGGAQDYAHHKRELRSPLGVTAWVQEALLEALAGILMLSRAI